MKLQIQKKKQHREWYQQKYNQKLITANGYKEKNPYNTGVLKV